MVQIKLTPLEGLDKILGNNSSVYYHEDKEMPPDDKEAQQREVKDYWQNGHKFLLDVEQTQGFYDDWDSRTHPLFTQPYPFIMPFDHTDLVFKTPLKINWSKFGNRRETAEVKLMAVGIKKLEEKADKDFTIVDFKAYLYFQEDTIPEEYEQPEGFGLSFQFVRFAWVFWPDGRTEVHHIGHYPCTNPYGCMIDKNGWITDWANDILKAPGKFAPKGVIACQEVLNRDALMESLGHVLKKIGEQKPHVIAKPRFNLPSWFPHLPGGWPYTKGNLPRDNYIQYLGGKQYVYNKEDINYGSGTKHRYRYDVRRHMRIVKDHIVWVDPYQRGSGRYIPKVYANSRTWYVPYVWGMVESLSKIRIFEIMIVKAYAWFKRLKKRL